ncbi:hypothetical protein GGI00_002690, partial [Coemansia sp. RSA 2681]
MQAQPLNEVPPDTSPGGTTPPANQPPPEFSVASDVSIQTNGIDENNANAPSLPTAQASAPPPARVTTPQLPNRIQRTYFSIYHLLEDRTLNLSEPPVKIVSTLPFTEFSCNYAIPVGTKDDEFSQAIVEAKNAGGPMAKITMVHAAVNPSSGIGIVAVGTAEDYALLQQVTVMLNGTPLRPKRIVEYKESHAHFFISGLKVTSFTKRAKDIVEALSPYGEIVDIICDRIDFVTYGHAKVILDMTLATSIPSSLLIGGSIARITGRRAEVNCNYCKQSGHVKDKCPKRPGNKKHAPSDRVSSAPAAVPSPPPTAPNMPSNTQAHDMGSQSSRRQNRSKGGRQPAEPSNKRPRNNASRESSPAPAQASGSAPTLVPERQPAPITSNPLGRPLITGAANFGPVTGAKSKKSGRSSAISLGGLVAAQSAQPSASQPTQASVLQSAEQSVDQAGKCPTTPAPMESEDSDIAMTLSKNQSPNLPPPSVASNDVESSESSATSCDSVDTTP